MNIALRRKGSRVLAKTGSGWSSVIVVPDGELMPELQTRCPSTCSKAIVTVAKSHANVYMLVAVVALLALAPAAASVPVISAEKGPLRFRNAAAGPLRIEVDTGTPAKAVLL